MFNKLTELYNEAAKHYDDLDKKISKVVEYDILGKERHGKEKIPPKNHLLPPTDELAILLNDINAYVTNLEDKTKKFEDYFKLLGTTLGHFNEQLIKKLSLKYDLTYISSSIHKNIKELEKYLSKSIVNDLHFLNNFRNSIIHTDDHGQSLSEINSNEILKMKYLNEAKSSYSKALYLYDLYFKK